MTIKNFAKTVFVSLLACTMLSACASARAEQPSTDTSLKGVALSYSSSDGVASDRVILLDTIYKGVYLERSDVGDFLKNMEGTTYGKYFARAWNEGPCYHSDMFDADIYIGTSIELYSEQAIKFDGTAGKVYDYTDKESWFDKDAGFNDEKVVETEYGSFVLYY